MLQIYFFPARERMILALSDQGLFSSLGLALLLQLGTATKIVCYFTNWSQYQDGIARYMPQDIDPCFCTHIIYTYAGMGNNKIKTTEWDDKAHYAGINSLKD
ncbi:acidic mammalian chitinase-like [Choloepus didactylus]|uniref:acidic mammalian chitinase-like n=1 Tax=Choloepus didactylus TaxID=27675 RepID=UPI0018A0BE61|nr:acidic mammalian chitinase-like [Choloepus didactylus]